MLKGSEELLLRVTIADINDVLNTLLVCGLEPAVDALPCKVVLDLSKHENPRCHERTKG